MPEHNLHHTDGEPARHDHGLPLQVLKAIPHEQKMGTAATIQSVRAAAYTEQEPRHYCGESEAEPKAQRLRLVHAASYTAPHRRA